MLIKYFYKKINLLGGEFKFINLTIIKFIFYSKIIWKKNHNRLLIKNF